MDATEERLTAKKTAANETTSLINDGRCQFVSQHISTNIIAIAPAMQTRKNWCELFGGALEVRGRFGGAGGCWCGERIDQGKRRQLMLLVLALLP